MVYILPFLAVILGVGIAYVVKPNSPKGMKLILSFSGAFLLGVLILEMLPGIYQAVNPTSGGLILLGILIQKLLEFLSKGAEHGHTHKHSQQQLPWVLLLSLCVHAFLEGLPLGLQSKLLWAISIHKITIGLVLGLLLFQTQNSGASKMGALLVFALMSPIGSFVGEYIPIPLLRTWIDPLVAGVLIHISTTILFETSEGHEFNLQKFLSIFLGMVLAILL